MKFCANCEAINVRFHRHHIVPRHRGGTDNATNIAILCHPCHGLVHDMSYGNYCVEKSIAVRDLKKEQRKIQLHLKFDARKKEGESYFAYRDLILYMFLDDEFGVGTSFKEVAAEYEKGLISLWNAQDKIWDAFCPCPYFYENDWFDYFISTWLVDKNARKMLIADMAKQKRYTSFNSCDYS